MSKSALNPKTGAEQAPVSDLPLFFKKPVPLDVTRHAKAALLQSQDATFAVATNSIVVNVAEFFEAAKYYPIVFLQAESPLPVAILGLEQKNYFVNSKGRWKDGTYVPAYVRKYPFILMDIPERKEFALCIDEAAPQFKASGAKGALTLFEDDKPTEATRNALEFCTAYQNHYQITRAFCEGIRDAGLLMPTRSDIKLANGREIHLGGFFAIDEKKVGELSDETIVDFHKKGWLPLIYASLISYSNWKLLVDMASEEDKSKAS